MKHLSQVLVFLFATAFSLTAQKVTVSKEISIRNDVAYDILGRVDDHIVLYRDRGNRSEVSVFDMDLNHIQDRTIEFENKNSDVYAVIPQDTCFSIIYGYREKRQYFLKAVKYDKYGSVIDTATYLNALEGFKGNGFRYVLSEDRSKTVLFSTRKSSMLFSYVIDNDNMEIMWGKQLEIDHFNVRKNFRAATVSNQGAANLLFELDNSIYDRKSHHLLLIGLDASDGFYENKFFLKNKLTVDLEMEYDNLNNRIILAGLLSDESEYDATGFFHFSQPIDELAEEVVIEMRDFDDTMLNELYGEKLAEKKKLNDFITREIVLRGDGGFLLFTEMNKEFFRRSSFNNGARGGGFSRGSGWVDIYNEEVIVFSFHPDGREHWKKILYKKQFSQDDQGIYSSFFLFKTDSRLRLIYNDEIKRDNTVSEYVLDPLGNYERNSLLSTVHQKLKLRFRDAVQLSANALLVPSERALNLSLVKIEYE